MPKFPNFGKEKPQAAPGLRKGPNLPTPFEQLAPPTPSGSDASLSARADNGPAFEPPAGQRHLLSAEDMAAHPNRVPAEVVLHLLDASNLPRLERVNVDSLTAYVIAWVIDHRGQPVGQRVRWPVRPDSRQPAWNAARDLGEARLSYRKLKQATLHAQVWHADPLLPHTLVGQLAVPLLSLLSPSGHVQARDATDWKRFATGPQAHTHALRARALPPPDRCRSWCRARRRRRRSSYCSA